MKTLPARPGLVDGFETLWKAGFEIYAVSNGSIESTKGLLAQTQPKNNPDVFTSGEFDKYIVSCDEVKRAKPNADIVRDRPKSRVLSVLADVATAVQACSGQSRSRCI